MKNGYLKTTILLGALFMPFASLADVNVEEAWVRLLPPVVKNTAAYMKITSSEADVLVGAESKLAHRVEVHQTVMEMGTMSMAPIERLELKANETAALSPAGTHLMVMGLKRELSEGEMLPFTLHFEHAGAREVLVQVRK